MPLNYLLIEAPQRFAYYFGEEYKAECPTGSGRMRTLEGVTVEMSRRLLSIFTHAGDGRRAVFGERATLQADPLWRDYIPSHEYFHGDTGAGLGASPDRLDRAGGQAAPAIRHPIHRRPTRRAQRRRGGRGETAAPPCAAAGEAPLNTKDRCERATAEGPLMNAAALLPTAAVRSR
jgi:hypothetical protein